jgi:hypothetical protein
MMSDTESSNPKERPLPRAWNKNPFEAPTAHVEDARKPLDDTLADEPNKLAAGRGLAWWREGWHLYREATGLWIGIGVVLMIINVAISLIPMVGDLASSLLFPVFIAGLMLGCHAIYTGEELRFDHLFAGFQNKPGRLLMIGVLCLLAFIAIFAVVAVIFVFGANFNLFSEALESAGEMSEEMNWFVILPVGLLGLALAVLLSMAAWFAPALVALHEPTAFEAIKLCFRGCLRNWLPFLVYGLMFIVFAILASLPLLLGWLVMIPLMYCSTYVAYRDIFTVERQ